MAFTEKVLADGKLSTTGETTVGTVPTGKHWVISNITIHNEDTSARTVSMKMGTDTQILTEEEIPTKKTLGLRQELGGHIVAATKTIKLTASVASKISYYISGVEVSD